MQAYADYSFPGTFFLDEERIRKISNIVNRRISNHPHNTGIKFVIYRSDSYVFETSDINDVTSQENTRDRHITALTFQVEHSSLRFTLSFSGIDGVSISIRGEDRDFVFLLYSDVKEYINLNVISPRRLSFRKETYELIGYGFMFLGLVYFIVPFRVVIQIL